MSHFRATGCAPRMGNYSVNSSPAPKSAHRVLRLGERGGSPQDWGGRGADFRATGCAPRMGNYSRYPSPRSRSSISAASASE